MLGGTAPAAMSAAAQPGSARACGSPPARAAPRSGWSVAPSAYRPRGARPRARRRSPCRGWAAGTRRRCAHSCAISAGRTGRPRPSAATAAAARTRRGSSTGWTDAAASRPSAPRRCPTCRSGMPARLPGSPPPPARYRPAARRRQPGHANAAAASCHLRRPAAPQHHQQVQPACEPPGLAQGAGEGRGGHDRRPRP